MRILRFTRSLTRPQPHRRVQLATALLRVLRHRALFDARPQVGPHRRFPRRRTGHTRFSTLRHTTLGTITNNVGEHHAGIPRRTVAILVTRGIITMRVTINSTLLIWVHNRHDGTANSTRHRYHNGAHIITMGIPQAQHRTQRPHRVTVAQISRLRCRPDLHLQVLSGSPFGASRIKIRTNNSANVRLIRQQTVTNRLAFVRFSHSLTNQLV